MARFERNQTGSSSLVAVIVVILMAVAVVAVSFLLGDRGSSGSPNVPPEEFVLPENAELPADPMAENGMLYGENWDGEKNPAGMLSYRVNGDITVKDGEGDFLLENPPRNVSAMQVSFLLEEDVIYQSGYLYPNQHIEKDALDRELSPGEYEVVARFEAFDWETGDSLGSTQTTVTITVEE